jgi:hypothetical protein
MKRYFIFISLVLILISGLIINSISLHQLDIGGPLAEERISILSCIQTLLWILFALISGTTLLAYPTLFVEWVNSHLPRKVNRLIVRLMGTFILLTILFAKYSILNDCKLLCEKLFK